jgi:hypothetical protein
MGPKRPGDRYEWSWVTRALDALDGAQSSEQWLDGSDEASYLVSPGSPGRDLKGTDIRKRREGPLVMATFDALELVAQPMEVRSEILNCL